MIGSALTLASGRPHRGATDERKNPLLSGKGGLLAVVVTLLIAAPAAARPGVPAVKAGKVYLLNGGELVVPGPRVVLTAQTFGRALDPDLMP